MYPGGKVCSRQDGGLRHLDVTRERSTNDSNFTNISPKSDHEMDVLRQDYLLWQG